jgi:transposase
LISGSGSCEKFETTALKTVLDGLDLSMTANESGTPRYLAINRNKKLLHPLDVERLIEADHPARKIWQLVKRLELKRFEQGVRAVEGHAGRSAHSPQVLISVWIYAYSRGTHSAREFERQMEYEPGLQWLTALRVINHHSLSDFRVEHGEALRELFVQVLAMMALQGLITLERVAADGSKIRANVNKKSFRREETIREHLELARTHVEELEKQEAAEDTTQRQKAARERAASERQTRLEEALKEIENLRAEKKHEKQKQPQASMSDPEARFMRTSDGGTAPAYNVQVVADAAQGVIVDVQVMQDPQDAHQLAPAMERLRESLGRYPQQALADSGYTNNESIVAMADSGIDYYGVMTGRTDNPSGRGAQRHPDYEHSKFVLDPAAKEMICPQGKRLVQISKRQLSAGREVITWSARAEDCRSCTAQPDCYPTGKFGKHGRAVSRQTSHAAVQAFDAKMQTEHAQAIYKQRAPLAEFPHAWIKTKLGLRRFATRGLAKVACEAHWAALTYNLQALFRLSPPQAT